MRRRIWKRALTLLLGFLFVCSIIPVVSVLANEQLEPRAIHILTDDLYDWAQNPPYKKGDVAYFYVMFNNHIDLACSSSTYLVLKHVDTGDEIRIPYRGLLMNSPTIAFFWFEVTNQSPGHYQFHALLGTCSGRKMNLSDYNLYDMTPYNSNTYNQNIIRALNTSTVFFDPEPPTVVSIKVTSDKSRLKAGDVVTIELTMNEKVTLDGTPSLLLNNNRKAVFKEFSDDKMLRFEYTVNPGDDIERLDLVQMEGVTLSDDIGNKTESPIAMSLDAGTNILIDTTPPTATIKDSHGNIKSSSGGIYAREHDLRLHVTDRDLDRVQIYHKWTTSSTKPAPEAIVDTGMGNEQPVEQPKDVNGDYYLHMKLIDDVGNMERYTFGPYRYDYDPPTVSFDADLRTSQDPIEIRVSATDALSGVKQLAYKWEGEPGEAEVVSGSTLNVMTPPNEKDHVLIITAIDHAGNSGTYRSETYRVDRTPPSVSFILQDSDAPAKSKTVRIEVAGDGKEDGRLYIQWTEVSSDPDDSAWKGIHDGALPAVYYLETPEDLTGTYQLHVKAIDVAGNMEITSSGGLVLDNKSPVIGFMPDGNEFYKPSSATQLNIVEPHLDKVYYAISESSEKLDEEESGWRSTDNGATIAIEGMTGVYYVHVRAIDEAANDDYVISQPFYVDHLAPIGNVSFEVSYTNKVEAWANFQAEDNLTDKTEMEMSYRVDGGAWGDWMTYTDIQRITLKPEEREQILEVRYRDEAGNVSQIYSASIIYDITPPQYVSHVLSPGGLTNGSVEVTLYYTDAGSGDGSVKQVVEENGEYRLTFSDQAGNTNSQLVMVTNIDKIKPTVSIEPDGLTVKRQAVSAIVKAEDDVSPASRIQVFYHWSKSSSEQPADWQPLSEDGSTEELAGVDGFWYLWVKAVDEAGNVQVKTSKPFELDNTPPTADILFSPDTRTALPVTATILPSEPVTVIEPEGAFSYVFEENGSFEFKFVDEAGNVGTAVAIVDWIDKDLPTANVTMSPDTWTNGNVDVTVDVSGFPPRSLVKVHASPEISYPVMWTTVEHGDVIELTEEMTVTKAVYRFTENGELSFTIVDLETDLQSTNTITVHQIDRVAPVGKLIYSHENWTNQDVTVRLEAEDDRSIVSADQFVRVFTGNGEYTFKFWDEAGNVSELTAVVDFIDKEPPKPVITFSTDTWTNEPVTATVEFIDASPVTILNNNGSDTYTFHENGTFTLMAVDAAGNTVDVKIEVDWIDREPPQGTFEYSTLGWTNDDVLVTLHAFDNSGAPVVYENGNTHLFTENGSHVFIVRDAAGNQQTFTAVVNRIDRVAPEAEIYYSITSPTNAMVRTVLSPSEPVTVLNNGGSFIRDFMDNGIFVFEIADRAGNTAKITASVDWIDRIAPKPSVIYSTTEPTFGDVRAQVTADEPFHVLNNNRNREYVFRENGSFTFYIQDLAGNTAEIEARVDNIDKSEATYTLNYSETAPTQNSVTVTVTFDRPVTILNNNGSPVVTFDRNGVFWMRAKDGKGMEVLIPIEVQNIDQTAPEIEFAYERILLALGEAFDPLADVRAMDQMDGDLTDRLQAEHGVNPHQVGEYQVTYKVTDRAGNEAVKTRQVIVVDPREWIVFVNSEDVSDGRSLLRAANLELSWFGAQGDVRIRWAYGKLMLGEMKRNEQFYEEAVPVLKQGYYTFLIEDQERRYELIHVYVIPTD